jgi:D-glutamate cyclase
VPEIAGENIDRVCTVEMRGRGLPRGKTLRLYERARARQGGPLSMLAAEGLREACRNGGTVLIGTGFGDPLFLPFGEVDGPVGAAALARTLSLAYGVTPIAVSEEPYLGPIGGAAFGAGMFIMNYSKARARKGAIVLVEQTVDASGAESAPSILDQYKPVAVIAIEKLGPNREGYWHSIFGFGTPEPLTYFHLIVEEARRRNIFTIGIGDGGNEIGFGAMLEDVWEIVPNGRKCQCPCGGGMATNVATDLIFPAAISDWGAYGIVAALSILESNLKLMHDAPMLQRMMDECVREGGAESTSCLRFSGDDGVPLDVNEGMIRMLGGIVANTLSKEEPVVIDFVAKAANGRSHPEGAGGQADLGMGRQGLHGGRG